MEIPNGLGKRIGIFGGTFDPVHNGHLGAAKAVKQAFGLDSILFIPASVPPHKKDRSISPIQDRIAMLECAVSLYPGFFVSSIEARRPGPSYSIDTLKGLRKRLAAQCTIFFIIGLDAFVEIASWKQYNLLLDEAHFVVISREEYGMESLGDVMRQHFSCYAYSDDERSWTMGGERGMIYPFFLEPIHVSSTEVRRLLLANASIGEMVPSCVEEYIRDNRLFGDGH